MENKTLFIFLLLLLLITISLILYCVFSVEKWSYGYKNLSEICDINTGYFKHPRDIDGSDRYTGHRYRIRRRFNVLGQRAV